MENAVKSLEAMFQKADSDINRLSQRVKFELESNEDKQQTNPAELLEKIGQVKKEYASLVQQAADIQEAQKEAVGEFRGHLNDICQLLLTLQSKSGSQLTEKPEELCRLEHFLGSEFPWGPDSESSADIDSASNSETTYNTTETSPLKDEPINSSVTSACSSIVECSASQRRQNTDEFVEVSIQEFESVSTLIRGKVKLTDVNSTYRVLWNLFKTNKDKRKLAADEMHKMGLKVSGVTGQAKLKVLRALKLITLTRNGEVSDVV